MTDEEIVQRVESAIDEAIRSEMKLLGTGGVEDTFTSTVRDKLLPKFQTETVTVDINYNKHHLATKMLSGNRIELDVAIHQRYNDRENLVAIEVETSNYPKRDDVWKVEDLTGGVDGYGYQLGLFIVIGVKNRAGKILEKTWYKNGMKM